MRDDDIWTRPLLHALVILAVAGLGLDVWSHAATERAETFFSIWHLPLYGSVAAVATIVLRERARESAGMRWSELGDVGLALMAVGGTSDAVWHEVAGVEDTIEGFFSASHLFVFAGLLLLALAPVQAALRRQDGARGGYVLLSAVAAAVVASIATMWATPFSRQPGHLGEDPSVVAAGMAAWIVQAVIVGLLVALVLRLWPDRPVRLALAAGLWWIGVAAVASRPKQAVLAVAIAASILVVHRSLAGRPGHVRATLVAAASGAAMTISWFGSAEITGTPEWSAHLISGAIAWSLLTAGTVARLLYGALSPTAPPESAVTARPKSRSTNFL